MQVRQLHSGRPEAEQPALRRAAVRRVRRVRPGPRPANEGPPAQVQAQKGCGAGAVGVERLAAAAPLRRFEKELASSYRVMRSYTQSAALLFFVHTLAAELIEGKILPSVKEAAKATSVSNQSVKSARRVNRLGSQKLKNAVVKNEVAVSVAAKLATLPKPEQRTAVKNHKRISELESRPSLVRFAFGQAHAVECGSGPAATPPPPQGRSAHVGHLASNEAFPWQAHRPPNAWTFLPLRRRRVCRRSALLPTFRHPWQFREFRASCVSSWRDDDTRCATKLVTLLRATESPFSCVRQAM